MTNYEYKLFYFLWWNVKIFADITNDVAYFKLSSCCTRTSLFFLAIYIVIILLLNNFQMDFSAKLGLHDWIGIITCISIIIKVLFCKQHLTSTMIALCYPICWRQLLWNCKKYWLWTVGSHHPSHGCDLKFFIQFFMFYKMIQQTKHVRFNIGSYYLFLL